MSIINAVALIRGKQLSEAPCLLEEIQIFWINFQICYIKFLQKDILVIQEVTITILLFIYTIFLVLEGCFCRLLIEMH